MGGTNPRYRQMWQRCALELLLDRAHDVLGFGAHFMEEAIFRTSKGVTESTSKNQAEGTYKK